MTQKMPLDVPSKTAVRKAGHILAADTAKVDVEAFSLLSKWRALHSYPINTFQATLRQKIDKLRLKNAIVAQRLKRAPSIIAKLQRFPSMGLERMQDIGGLRIILDSVNDVYRLHDNILKSRFTHKPEIPPFDYIEIPKNDGYRSLHQVFRYNSRRFPELRGLRIELQIRTRLQHAWATAVETLGIIEKSSFKTGEGKDEFKHFFKLSSALFSIHENKPVVNELKNHSPQAIAQEFEALQNRLHIFMKLKGLALSAKHIETVSNTSAAYHIVELNAQTRKVSLTPFKKTQMQIAESLYKGRELDTRDNPDIDVVLISAGNLKAIKQAYPNYFLDTDDFIRNLKKICANIKTSKN